MTVPGGAVHRVCTCLMMTATVRPTMLAGAIIVSVGAGVGRVGPPSSQAVALAGHIPISNNLAARSSIMRYFTQRGDRDGVVFTRVANTPESSSV